MRAILLSLALLIFTCYNVFSQQAYERSFPAGISGTYESITFSTLDNTLWMASAENGDVKLYHLDATGNVISSFLFSGMLAYSVNIEQGVNGNIYLSGDRMTTGVEYYVLGLDFTGALLWSKTYAVTANATYAESKLRALDNGNVMVIEGVYGHLGYIEINGSTGAVVNSAQFREDTTAENKTPGFAGDVFGDGSYVFTGKRGNDICMVRTDAGGNILWSTVMNSGSAYYHTKSVAACSDGSVLSCGLENYSGFIMKTDANGITQWFNAYSGGWVFYDIEQIDANTFGAVAQLGANFLYARFDMSGNELGSILFTYPGYSFHASELAVNAAGKVLIPFGYEPPQQFSSDLGLLVLEPGFNMECGMESYTLTASTTSSDPSLLAVPIYKMPEPVFETPLTVTRTILQVSGDNMCVILGAEEPLASLDFSLQNSPAEQGNAVTFSLGEYRGNVAYYVTDALGREVIREDVLYSGGMQPIKQSDQLSGGIYLFTTVVNGETFTEKFVIR